MDPQANSSGGLAGRQLEQALLRARRAIESGRESEALLWLVQALDLDPRNCTAHGLLCLLDREPPPGGLEPPRRAAARRVERAIGSGRLGLAAAELESAVRHFGDDETLDALRSLIEHLAAERQRTRPGASESGAAADWVVGGPEVDADRLRATATAAPPAAEAPADGAPADGRPAFATVRDLPIELWSDSRVDDALDHALRAPPPKGATTGPASSALASAGGSLRTLFRRLDGRRSEERRSEWRAVLERGRRRPPQAPK